MKQSSFPSTASLRKFKGTDYSRNAFSVFHFSNKNIKMNHTCFQSLANTQFWKK